MSTPSEDVPGPDEFQRMHPLTPLLTGWKVIAGLLAVLGIQNIRALTEELTLTRLGIAGLSLLAVTLVVIALNAVSWSVTRYAVTEHGVFVTKRLFGVHHRIAPRERIDSVSIQRPLLPRLLGLAKVRIELAGGGPSGVDITYVTSARAEEIYREVLQLTNQQGELHRNTAQQQTVREPEHPQHHDLRSRAHSFLFDHVTEGRLLAQIPTSRLLRSLLRDLGIWAGLVISLIIAISAVITLLDSFSLIALLPTFAAALIGPRLLFNRLEAGWGFISRSTDAGLRVRRGLFNTCSDSISANRVQQIRLVRPLLWRQPGWTRVTADTAGAEELDDEATSGVILPVGTREELAAALTRMLPPIDLEFVHHMLDHHPSALTGLRPTSRLLTPIARSREVTVLTEGFLLKRWGLISTNLVIIPRERIHCVQVTEGPLERKRAHCTLVVNTAGDEGATSLTLRRVDGLPLADQLRIDAATSRRYRDRKHWARPADDNADDDAPLLLNATQREQAPAGGTVEA